MEEDKKPLELDIDTDEQPRVEFEVEFEGKTSATGGRGDRCLICCLFFSILVLLVFVAGIVVFGLFYYQNFISGELATLDEQVAQLEMQLNRSRSAVSALRGQLSSAQYMSQIQFQISEIADAQRRLTESRGNQNSALTGMLNQARMNYTRDIGNIELAALDSLVQQAQIRYAQGVQDIETNLGTTRMQSASMFEAQLNADAAHAKITITNEQGMNFSNGILSQLGDITRSTYIRWGSSSCPDVAGTTLIYSGVVGGSAFFDRGGGHNQVCMPLDPELDGVLTEPGLQGRSRIYGSEYTGDLNDHNVPCAVCSVTIGAEVIMIPARNSCPSSWTLEYDGYLMSESPNNRRSSFICVDRSREIVPGFDAHADATDLFYCRVDCPNLFCPPYDDTMTIGCAVCSK